MTGRRLYELICDGWGGHQLWQRTSDYNRLGLPADLPAWPFLSYAEKRTFNLAAARLKGVRR